jgi:hypothetical protein
MARRKVWITRPLEDLNLEVISKHGYICYAFGKDMIPLHTRSQQTTVVRYVLDLASPDDLILIAGPSIMLTVLVYEFTMKFHRVNALMYRRPGIYYVQAIDG